MNNNNLTALDIMSILSYILQIQNSEEDKNYKRDVQDFENLVQKEVDRLHKENDEIVSKLDEILRRLE